MNTETNPLVELIYYSRSIATLTNEDFAFLLQGAQQKNHQSAITGAILYCHGYFLQLIEGPRDNINRLFQSISHDARHFDISLVSFRNIEERSFPDWDMNYVEVDVLDGADSVKLIEQINAQACFELFGGLKQA